MAVTLLTILTPKTSLVLIFFASLALVSRRLLVFAIRYVSRKSVNRLSPFGVLLFFFHGPIHLVTL